MKLEFWVLDLKLQLKWLQGGVDQRGATHRLQTSNELKPTRSNTKRLKKKTVLSHDDDDDDDDDVLINNL